LLFDPIQNVSYMSIAHTQLYARHKEKAR
jgi:hypothetical protein